MIKLMLDTNIIIYIMKQNPLSVLQKFEKYTPDEVAISSIVYAELMYGVYNSQRPTKNLRSVHALVDNFTILEFDSKAALLYGKVKSRLKNTETLIGDNDLLIGSHALSLKLPLITNNTKEFKRIPELILENWA